MRKLYCIINKNFIENIEFYKSLIKIEKIQRKLEFSYTIYRVSIFIAGWGVDCFPAFAIFSVSGVGGITLFPWLLHWIYSTLTNFQWMTFN